MAAFAPLPTPQQGETQAEAFVRVFGRQPQAFELAQGRALVNPSELSTGFQQATQQAQQGFGSVGFSSEEILSPEFQQTFGGQQAPTGIQNRLANQLNQPNASQGSGGVNPRFQGGTSGDTGATGLAPSGSEQRPIEVFASRIGMPPQQAWQMLVQRGKQVGQRPMDLLNRALEAGGSGGIFGGAGPQEEGGEIFGGGTSPPTGGGTGPSGTIPVTGGGTSGDTGGGGIFPPQSGPQGPLGGPRGQGPADDPLFGATFGAPEFAGGREGGFQFRTTPGFNFRMALNRQALENSAAARGGLLSGNTLKDLSRFSQGLAESEFQNVFNMLGALRGGGATGRISNAALQTGQGIAGSLGGIGQGLAQGALGAGQAGGFGAFQSGQFQGSGLAGALGSLSTIDFGSLFEPSGGNTATAGGSSGFGGLG